jgi:very-short-patch-repair endonuclease
VVVRHGVRVTTPARSLIDAGAVVPPWMVGQCVELALTRRLVTVAGLRVAIDEHSRRGRTGVGILRSYLDQRALGDRRPESVLEPLMARLCRDHGVGPIEYQPVLMLDGQEVRPDFGIFQAMLAVEVDGLDAHGSREALDRDLTRQNLLVTHGYQVLRYTRTHLRRPRQVADQIIRVARQRIELLGGSRAA